MISIVTYVDLCNSFVSLFASIQLYTLKLISKDCFFFHFCFLWWSWGLRWSMFYLTVLVQLFYQLQCMSWGCQPNDFLQLIILLCWQGLAIFAFCDRIINVRNMKYILSVGPTFVLMKFFQCKLWWMTSFMLLSAHQVVFWKDDHIVQLLHYFLVIRFGMIVYAIGISLMTHWDQLVQCNWLPFLSFCIMFRH